MARQVGPWVVEPQAVVLEARIRALEARLQAVEEELVVLRHAAGAGQGAAEANREIPA